MAHDSSEGLKIQLDVLMAEYQQLRGDISSYRQMQSQLDSLALTGLGVAISLLLLILDRDMQNIGLALLFPTLFYAVAISQFRHERALLTAAMYVNAELRPQVNKLLSQLSSSNDGALGYEEFLSSRSWAKSILIEWLATTSRAAVSLAVAVGIILIYLYARLFVLSAAWNPYEGWLLVLNALLISATLFISFRIARARFRYLKDYYNK